MKPLDKAIRWLASKFGRMCAILQLNYAALLLLSAIGSDTGRYWLPGLPDMGPQPLCELAAKYLCLVLAISLAVGMLARRPWAFYLEGTVWMAIGAVLGGLILCQPRGGFGGLVLLFAMPLICTFFFGGLTIVREGKRLQGLRLADLRAHGS